MRPNRVNSGREKGITMIEILVTLVIVSIGLLGAAAMVINGLESNRNAYLRTQASILAYDMADRIRANSERALAGDYDGFDIADAPDLPGCYSSGSGCNSNTVVNVDKALWARSLEGAAEGATMLPEASGTIERNGETFDITITWKEVRWNADDSEFNDDVDQQFVLTFNL